MNSPKDDDIGDDMPGFTWLERSADGFLVVLAFGSLLSALAVYLFHGGILRNGLILAIGLSASAGAGYFWAERMGRGFAGGVFLWRWLRVCLIASVFIAFTASLWIGLVRPAERPRAVQVKTP